MQTAWEMHEMKAEREDVKVLRTLRSCQAATMKARQGRLTA